MGADDFLLEPWPRRVTELNGPDVRAVREVTSEIGIRLNAERVEAYVNGIQQGRRMPLIEIKGLSASVGAVKTAIGDLRTSAAALNTESSSLKAEIDDLTAQVKQHRADLRFEAETLGNGSGEKTSQGS